jgi:hypothetical protein
MKNRVNAQYLHGRLTIPLNIYQAIYNNIPIYCFFGEQWIQISNWGKGENLIMSNKTGTTEMLYYIREHLIFRTISEVFIVHGR